VPVSCGSRYIPNVKEISAYLRSTGSTEKAVHKYKTILHFHVIGFLLHRWAAPKRTIYDQIIVVEVCENWRNLWKKDS
jgi:hypothetical protein